MTAPVSAPLTAGTQAPDFTLPQQDGTPLTLSALRPGKVVLYFYPKDSTPGCTLEAQDFTRLKAAFEAAGTTVIGVSKDSVKRHANFCQKSALSITLLSDEKGTTCEDYGTWAEKQTFGRSYMGIRRTTFLIDGTGRIAKTWEDVSVKGHAEAVLDAARAL